MQDIEKMTRRCPACGEVRASVVAASDPPAEGLLPHQLVRQWAGLRRNKAFFSYVRCAACGLVYNPTYFSRRTLAQLYADLEPNMDMVPPHMVAATQRGYFDTVADKSDLSGGFLEIGPDIGYMVGEAARRGNFERYWLYEPNLAVHDQLREAAGGKPAIITDEMEDLAAVPDGTVGLAVMIHVLDHLIKPAAMVRQIARKLKPGGVLAIVTHNEGSLLRRLLGTRWPPFCLQHPQLFSPRTMRGLLGRAGFDHVEVRAAANVFPSDFLLRQAGQAVGLGLARVSFPAIALRLRLGNILTLARVSAQAAEAIAGTELESAR
ncbi:class I SAM-dependent methyltransferase [Aurantiacibacter hainanensis]|uniref:class I SAM-dependent methyltransferase n=1 Tax=Aurantiacibacter hainanensis TaxID=3076114 RepID=UPI0030C6EEBA